MSLNYAGLAHLVREDADRGRLARWGAKLVMAPLSRRFQMERLVRFNQKFSPEWRPRYLVYDSRAALPRTVMRVLQAEGYVPERRRLLFPEGRLALPRCAAAIASRQGRPVADMRRPRLWPHRPGLMAVTLAVAVIGLIGAYSYWESYYQHRGFATVAFLPHAHRGRRSTVHFYSPALHREADYLVYLPPGYAPTRRRYPVVLPAARQPGPPGRSTTRSPTWTFASTT